MPRGADAARLAGHEPATRAAAAERRPRRRWIQLAAAVVAMMAIANLQYAWTLFTLPLAGELGASLSAVQVAFTLFILLETWLLPIEGYLIDRFGASRIIAAAGVLVGLAWVGSGLAQSLGQLYFWYSIGGVGAGAVYGACIGTALKWFPDRRGLAAGVAAGAYGFGTALTILPIQHTIATQGYRSTFIWWGVAQGVVVLLAAGFISRPPGGWPAAVPRDAPAPVSRGSVNFTPFEMVRTGTFWLMYAIMTLVAFGGLMITAQLTPIARSYGMDRTIPWFGISALGLALVLDRIVNGLTRPFWGWISDQIGRYNAMAIAFTVEAAAICTLMSLIDRPVWFVVLSSVVFFAWGEIYSLFPAAIADVFGSRHAAANYGLQYTAKGTAAILAGWGAAALVEATGSWLPVFWVAAGFDLLAAAAAFFWLKPLVTAQTADASACTRAPPGFPPSPTARRNDGTQAAIVPEWGRNSLRGARAYDGARQVPGTRSAVQPAVLWFTGLSGAGKSTIAREVCERLRAAGARVELLDGDAIRGVFPNTGFSKEERDAHVRRVGFLASRLEHHGVFVVCALISPYAESRAHVRGLCRRYVEIYVSTPLHECERRDVKGLYERARRGEVSHFTGLDDPYEPPLRPDLAVDTTELTVLQATDLVMATLERGEAPPAPAAAS